MEQLQAARLLAAVTHPWTRNPKPETRNPKPATRNPQPGTRNPQPEIRNPKPETQNLKPDTENLKSSLDPNPQTLGAIAVCREAHTPTGVPRS